MSFVSGISPLSPPVGWGHLSDLGPPEFWWNLVRMTKGHTAYMGVVPSPFLLWERNMFDFSNNPNATKCHFGHVFGNAGAWTFKFLIVFSLDKRQDSSPMALHQFWWSQCNFDQLLWSARDWPLCNHSLVIDVLSTSCFYLLFCWLCFLSPVPISPLNPFLTPKKPFQSYRPINHFQVSNLWDQSLLRVEDPILSESLGFLWLHRPKSCYPCSRVLRWISISYNFWRCKSQFSLEKKNLK